MRRIHFIRGTTQIGLHPLSRIQTYTPPGNGCGLRQFLLPLLTFKSSGFKSALESPFSNSVHTAIPPPAALCDLRKMLTPLSHRFVFVVTYHNAARQICQLFFTGLTYHSSCSDTHPAVPLTNGDLPAQGLDHAPECGLPPRIRFLRAWHQYRCQRS